MVHILLMILKIIGILLLVILGLLLLTLLLPVTYKVKGSFNQKQYNVKLSFGWLFHLIHFGLNTNNLNTKIRFRLFGIPINILNIKSGGEQKKSKDKKRRSKNKETEIKKDRAYNIKADDKSDMANALEQEENISYKREEENYNKKNKNPDNTNKQEEKNEDLKNNYRSSIKDLFCRLKNFWIRIKDFIFKTIQKIKNALKDIKGAYNKYLEIKKFVTSNTTKEAYRFGKKYILKLIKHIFPRKIKANIHYGFGEPDITGKSLGYIAMTAGAFNVNMKKISIEPDFDKKVIEGNIKMKGHITAGVLLYYALRIYFKKEIHYIIKKFI